MKKIILILFLVLGLVAAIAVAKKDLVLETRTRILGQSFSAEIKNKSWQEYETECKEPQPCKGFHYFVNLGWNTPEGQAGTSVQVSNTVFDSLREGQSVPIRVYGKHVILSH